MRKTLGLILSLVLLLGVTFGMTGCGTKTLKLADYITIDVGGYSSLGQATYSVDYEGLASDSEIMEKVYKATKKNDYAFLAYDFDLSDSAADQIKHYLSLVDTTTSFNESTELSNGDEVVLTLECNEAVLKNLADATGLKIDATGTVKQKVEGLVELDEVNPFDLVKAVYTIDDDYDTYYVKGTGKTIDTGILTFDFEPDKIIVNKGEDDETDMTLNVKYSEDALHPGDSVELSISVKEDAFVDEGVLLTETSKTYEVKEATRAKKDQFTKESIKEFKTYVANSTSDEVTKVFYLYNDMTNRIDAVTHDVFYTSYYIGHIAADENGEILFPTGTVSFGTTYTLKDSYQKNYTNSDDKPYTITDLSKLL